MASIQKLPQSSKWIAFFRTPAGKLKAKSTGFPATGTFKVKAMRVAEALELAARDVRIVGRLRRLVEDIAQEMNAESRKPATIREFCQAWLESKRMDVTPVSMQSYQVAVKHLLDWLGDDAVRDILSLTRDRLQAYRGHLATTRTPVTANNQFKILRMIFRQARVDGVIFTNPAEGVARVKEPRKERRRPFTQEELRAVLTAADGEWRGLVLFGLYSGQRLGDLAQLTWENVDLAADGGMGQIRLITRKTGRSQIIPLHTALRDYLAGLKAGDDPRAFLFPRAAAAMAAAKGKTGTLSNQFTGILRAAGLRETNSEPRRERRPQILARVYGVTTLTLRRWIAAGKAKRDACPLAQPAAMLEWWARRSKLRPSRGLLDAAARYPNGVPGLPGEADADRKKETASLTFHSLRHTATSMLKSAGISASVVMDLIGHDDAAMSQHYTHTGDSERRRAVDSLPAL